MEAVKPLLAGKGINALLVVIVVAAIVAIADQLTKIAVLDLMQPGEQLPLIPGFFNLTLVFNKGAAFGMFANLDDGVRHYTLGAATLLALSAVFYFLYKEFRRSALTRIALAMILGGAIGNVIDRIGRGQVVDFLDFYYKEYHWPAFNIADSAICIGVAVLLIFGARQREDSSSAEART